MSCFQKFFIVSPYRISYLHIQNSRYGDTVLYVLRKPTIDWTREIQQYDTDALDRVIVLHVHLPKVVFFKNSCYIHEHFNEYAVQ